MDHGSVASNELAEIVALCGDDAHVGESDQGGAGTWVVNVRFDPHFAINFCFLVSYHFGLTLSILFSSQIDGFVL